MKADFTLEKIPQTQEEKDNYIIGFTITQKIVDRDREVLDPSTMGLKQFAATGSLTLWHAHYDFPIGHPVRIFAADSRIQSWFKFDVGESDDDRQRAKTAYNKVLSGSLVNGSLEALGTPKTIGEIIDNGGDDWYVEYRYLELTQFSLVVTPSNKKAVTMTTNRERCTIIDTRGEEERKSFERFKEELSTV